MDNGCPTQAARRIKLLSCIAFLVHNSELAAGADLTPLRAGSLLRRYKDMLMQPPKLKTRIDFDEDDSSFLDVQKYIISRKRISNQSNEDFLHYNHNVKSHKATGNPVVYRYFGRNRARSVRAESIPFIVIAPCVDHWKIVGKILAARGFSMIAIERPRPNEGKNNDDNQALSDGSTETFEGEVLVTSILEALKWQKAILVGCDKECVLALEAALHLPDRVVGLLLCGDLSFALEYAHHEMKNMELSHDDKYLDTETFLQHFVECPCKLICDDAATSTHTTKSDQISSISKKILGGGLAPHRRLPEQFTWLLTRFVEEKVSIFSGKNHEKSSRHANDSEAESNETINKSSDSRTFLPEMLLVSGRVFATALMYMSIAKVSLYQYKSIRDARIQFDISVIFNKSRQKLVKMIVNSSLKLSKMIPSQFILRNLFRSAKAGENSIINTELKNDVDLKQDQCEDKTKDEAETRNQDDSSDDDVDDDVKDNFNENGLTNPLLQKLLFFDQIIS